MAADETITWTEHVSCTIRSYYSIGWLKTADIMKGNAESVGGDKKRPDPPNYDKMRAFVLSAVTASAAFLESHINELYDDSHEYLGNPAVAAEALRGLDPKAQTQIAALWPDIKKCRVIKKYNVLLDLAEGDPLLQGAEPTQSANDLLRVRNHYLHYQPYSAHDGTAQGNDKVLSQRMRSKLDLPEWDNGNEDLFPSRAICPDLARWAVESAVRYADAFCNRLGMTPVYDHVRPDWLR